MTDEHEWVRRLLAEAGGDAEPIPPHVADRLGAALAGLDPLEADRAADDDAGHEPGEGPGQVVPMTGRRHRRWGAALLAAAAITVGGYSLVATDVLDTGTGSAESAAGGDAAVADEQAGGASAGSAESDAGAESLATAADVPAWSSRTLRRDAAELVRSPRTASRDEGLSPDRSAPQQSAPDLAVDDLSASQGRDCVPPPSVVAGTRHPVTYDGDPATAVVRDRTAGAAVVEVWSCEAPTRLGRVLVPPGR